jgi:hypothetical protein
MRTVPRVLGWVISFAVVVAVGAEPTGQKPHALNSPDDAFESAVLSLSYRPGDPLHVICLDGGMCCGSLWFDDAQCQAEYTTEFGGTIMAHFDGSGADGTYLTSWECGVDNLSRAPSPARLEKLRIGMTRREVEEVLALPLPDRPCCLSGYWEVRCRLRLHGLGGAQ